MLLKTSQYNELRAEKDDLKTRYTKLEQVAKERDIQVASLGSLASEVSSLYGLKSDPDLVSAASPDKVEDGQVNSSMNRLYTLKDTALSGATTAGLTLGLTRNLTTADWVRANSAPNLWPVEGPVTGSFGERIDPFNGEGAFHSGIDIGALYGQPIVAPAEAVVQFADSWAAMDARSFLTTATELPPAMDILRASPYSPDSTCIGATPSATSATADAAPGPTCTMKFASTMSLSILTSICA